MPIDFVVVASHSSHILQHHLYHHPVYCNLGHLATNIAHLFIPPHGELYEKDLVNGGSIQRREGRERGRRESGSAAGEGLNARELVEESLPDSHLAAVVVRVLAEFVVHTPHTYLYCARFRNH